MKLLSVCALVFLAACSKVEPSPPPPAPPPEVDASTQLDDMERSLLANLSKTCEGTALAAAQSTADAKTRTTACRVWHVHGDAPAGTPHELAKTSVLVWCESPRAFYAVKIATGDVLTLEEPSKPLLLETEREAAKAAAKACAHIYD